MVKHVLQQNIKLLHSAKNAYSIILVIVCILYASILLERGAWVLRGV